MEEQELLSRFVRNNIVTALKKLQTQGDFNQSRLWNLDFDKLEDKTLIVLRDNELVHTGEFGDKEYVGELKNYLYDEDVFKYWNIKKENVK